MINPEYTHTQFFVANNPTITHMILSSLLHSVSMVDDLLVLSLAWCSKYDYDALLCSMIILL